MTGVCRGKGFNVGFGSVEGVVLPAVQLEECGDSSWGDSQYCAETC